MGTWLKVTIAASSVSLVAGMLIAFFIKSHEAEEIGLKPYVHKPLRPASTEEYVPASKLNKKTGSHSIENLDILKQLPELPTGCEVTSLTMVLNYYGYDAGKIEIAREYLEKEDLARDEDDILYGPDFRYVFPGDPEEASSFGCLAPCIVSAAKSYIEDYDNSVIPVDLTGTSFYDLLSYTDHDVPVIMWITLDLSEPEYICSWITPEGNEVTWPTNEHCVVLSAYNYDDNTVQLHDPINGIVTYDMEKVKRRYDQIGENAVIIVNKKK